MKKLSSDLLKKREIKSIIIAIVILTFVFGFNDKRPEFLLSYWLSNLVTVFILVAITIFVHVLGNKLAGSYFNCKVNFEIWNFKYIAKIPTRITKKYLTLFNGPVIAILLTLISYGRFYFSAVSTFSVEAKKRIERRFQYVTEYETALIAFVSLFFNLILLFIFRVYDIKQGVLINTAFILFNLLPFSEIEGAKIFFGSKTLYIFSVIFFATSILLTYYFNIISSFLISLIIAIGLALIYFYIIEYKKD